MPIEQLHPRDRSEWLAMRQSDITASTVGALFGVHDFQTPYQLWAEKTGRLGADQGENDAMRRGRLLEPVAVQIIREDRPDWTILHSAAANTYYRDAAARLGGTPDVRAMCPQRGLGVVQIKSVEQSVFRRKWMVEGEIEVPLWIALQASVEAYLTGAQWAAVAPLVVGFGVECPIIDIPLVDGLIDSIKERVAEFWAMAANGIEPAFDYGRDGDTIAKLYPAAIPGKTLDWTKDNRIEALLAELTEAKQVGKAADERADEIKTEIKAKMGEAETAILPSGKKVTWKTQSRAETVVKASTFRVLRAPNL